jgi:hypothetical protein
LNQLRANESTSTCWIDILLDARGQAKGEYLALDPTEPSQALKNGKPITAQIHLAT